jgi:hypothetical protein
MLENHMKTHCFDSLPSLALLGLLLASTTVSAQSTTTVPTKQSYSAASKVVVDRMAAELKLDENQKGKLAVLIEEVTRRGKEIRNETNLPPEQRRLKLTELLQDQHNRIRGILKPEQIEKWQRVAERMHPPSPASHTLVGQPTKHDDGKK